MPIFTLGVTVILARLFPYPALWIAGRYGSFFTHLSFVWFPVVILLATYLPPAIVAIIFVRKAKLRNRLPHKIPGQTPILIGLILIVLYMVPRFYASTIPGGGAAYVVSIYGPLFIIPANILIIMGVTKTLLATLPRLPIHSARTAAGYVPKQG
ncbi:hypothetical protein [Rhizobium sp.]|jgi:hypothetical protein|uniref:hypothetical protein n=1 Tax=Rhizobium sp. TaxID=391 RepID=UPI000E85ACC3|nr:hypothetical protein [Rhizobium sp.]